MLYVYIVVLLCDSYIFLNMKNKILIYSKFKVQNTKFKIQSSKYKVQNTKFKIQSSKYDDIINKRIT
jgi:hypothetical protein